MITLLSKRLQSVLRVFYEHQKESFHLRELARLCNLHEPSVSQALKTLESENILLSKKIGNQKHFSLQKNKRVFSLLQSFDLERFQSLPMIRQRAMQIFIDKLLEKPVAIILFGSTAKNSFSSSSDIDLLLITNSNISTSKAIKEAFALTGINISDFQLSCRAFFREVRLKEDKVIQSAIATGYPVYGALQYYELIYGE